MYMKHCFSMFPLIFDHMLLLYTVHYIILVFHESKAGNVLYKWKIESDAYLYAYFIFWHKDNQSGK